MNRTSYAMLNDAAADAVEDIIRDLDGRKGMGDEWYQIDGEIQSEIKLKWTKLIVDACAKARDV